MLDQRNQLLRAAVGFAECSMPSYDRALHALRFWLDTWTGIGHVAVGMHRQGYDLQLTQYDERGWRATFYVTGMEHSPTSATGTGWERTPWHARQRAAWEALRKADKGGAAGAQPAELIYRIGFLGASSLSTHASRVEAFRAGLRELGYVEGKNIRIEYRWADGKYERLPDLAGELVGLRVDVLVTFGTSGAIAAKQTTLTIPIVMAGTGNAVATGLVTSLARPACKLPGP